METLATRAGQNHVANAEAATRVVRDETLADRALTVLAMAGGVGGAVGGVIVGADIGTAFPLAVGTLGTMVGGGATAGGWCLVIRVWKGVVAAAHRPVADSHPVAPVPRLG